MIPRNHYSWFGSTKLLKVIQETTHNQVRKFFRNPEISKSPKSGTLKNPRAENPWGPSDQFLKILNLAKFQSIFEILRCFLKSLIISSHFRLIPSLILVKNLDPTLFAGWAGNWIAALLTYVIHCLSLSPFFSEEFKLWWRFSNR